MHPQPYEPPVEIRSTEAEAIVWAYRLVVCGDPWVALGRAIEDALADLDEAERRSLRRDRLVSRGYVRGGLPGAAA
ncbi:hypothetical protein FV232_26155 [Methylobacterium sp. WL30]|uniref:hypothetical protein n=1 Tax=Methylobacterium sp. WL116 TaxID=2603889 RepID=UPI0011C7EE2F|nr:MULTISPECIES: hypothetical protein [unclassified Methylobacterium]TXM94913.1 hypothetical protein FV223_02925 [Methylobacterium sp. WL116]TXN39333.1 hypothetical protein FV225_10110 [Methylobacterium sp. WL93]TXN45802.1 hypothetical protein FV227_24540 [Methylobacterium sp. WL119]TXN62064.1 hypothetical protein FV232_26155 [Methylobacterium sp. WL30]